MTGSLDTLFASLDQQIRDLIQERQAARADVVSLELENRQLRERLALVEGRLTDVVSHVKAMAAFDTPTEASSEAPLQGGSDGATAKSVVVPKQASPRPENDVTATASVSTLHRNLGTGDEKPDSMEEDAPSAAPLVVTPLTSLSDNDEMNADMPTSSTEMPAQHDANAPSPQQLLKQWYLRYPQAFFKAHTRPLQIGIHEALIAAEPWSTRLVRRTLACYVNLPRYMKSMRPGAERIDLQGQPAGQVTEEESRHARKQLKRLQTRQKEREQAQQQRRISNKLEVLQRQHDH